MIDDDYDRTISILSATQYLIKMRERDYINDEVRRDIDNIIKLLKGNRS